MKKTFYLFAEALLLLMGCAKIQNEDVISEKGKRTVSLNASIDASDTRISVTINGEEARYSWQEGDAILVMTVYDDMYGCTDVAVTSGSIGQDGATARFDVDLDEGYELGKYAFYPVNWQCWDFDDHLEFGLSDYYFYEEGVTNMPMLGTITSTGARFRAVGGLLKVTIENIPTSACRLHFSVPGKKITGSFTVTGSPKQITTRDMDEEYNEMDGDWIDFWFGEEGVGGGDFPGGGEGPEGGEGGTIGLRSPMTFYIPLPCGKYNNLTFSIFGEDFDEPLFTRIARMDNNHDGIFSDEEGIDIHRNEIVVAPTLEFVMDQNLPQAIFLDMEQYEDDLDENGVLHVDQYDDEIGLVASIKGKYSRALDEFDADLIFCQLVNVTDPENIVRTPIAFEYVEDYDFNVSIPTDHDGVFKLQVYYDKDGDNPLSAESCTFKVHKAALLPEALKNWKASNNDFWFSKYRVFDDDGNAYLKTYAAGTLYGTSYLYPEIPNNAVWEGPFNNAFSNSSTPGSFDAFQFFEKLTKVPNYAFSNCPYLTGITLPDAVTEIGKAAFYDCKIQTVTLSSNLVTIGVEAFKECEQLGQIVLPNTVTTISNEAFYGCLSLSSINIPESVTTIGEWAFGSCALNHVIIPTSVSTIGDKAFGNCSLLEYAVFEGTTPPTISEGIDPVFEDGVTIYVPDGSESAYGAVFGNCTILPISQKPAGN